MENSEKLATLVHKTKTNKTKQFILTSWFKGEGMLEQADRWNSLAMGRCRKSSTYEVGNEKETHANIARIVVNSMRP